MSLRVYHLCYTAHYHVTYGSRPVDFQNNEGNYIFGRHKGTYCRGQQIIYRSSTSRPSVPSDEVRACTVRKISLLGLLLSFSSFTCPVFFFCFSFLRAWHVLAFISLGNVFWGKAFRVVELGGRKCRWEVDTEVFPTQFHFGNRYLFPCGQASYVTGVKWLEHPHLLLPLQLEHVPMIRYVILRAKTNCNENFISQL